MPKNKKSYKKSKKHKNQYDHDKTNNMIIGIIKIENDNDVRRVINSYERMKTKYPNLDIWKYIDAEGNEKEIKECDIFINDVKMEFSYYYKFPKRGNYIIKYKFKKTLNSTYFMFNECYSLISLDLSNFNTHNVTNMSYMFYKCKSLAT